MFEPSLPRGIYVLGGRLIEETMEIDELARK
jgi:hypothetical protein